MSPPRAGPASIAAAGSSSSSTSTSTSTRLRECALRISRNLARTSDPVAVLRRLYQMCPSPDQQVRAFCTSEADRQAMICLLISIEVAPEVPQYIRDSVPEYVLLLQHYVPLHTAGFGTKDVFVNDFIKAVLVIAKSRASDVRLVDHTLDLFEKASTLYIATLGNGLDNDRNEAILYGILEAFARFDDTLPLAASHLKRMFGCLEALLDSGENPDAAVEVDGAVRMNTPLATLCIQTLTKSLAAAFEGNLLQRERDSVDAVKFCAEIATARLDNRGGARHDAVGTKAAAIELLATCTVIVADYRSDTAQHAMSYLRNSERIVTADELQHAQVVLSSLRKSCMANLELITLAADFLKSFVISVTFGHLSSSQIRIRVRVSGNAMTTLVDVLCEILADELKHQTFQQSVCKSMLASVLNAANKGIRPNTEGLVEATDERLHVEARRALFLLGDVIERVAVVDAAGFAYPALVDLVTTCTTHSMAAAVSQQLARIAVVHQSEYFEPVLDTFVSTYRSSAVPEEEPSVPGSSVPPASVEHSDIVLHGVASGLLSLCTGLSGDPNRQRHLRSQVLNLFINLGTEMYATAATSRNQRKNPSNVGEELGYLLPVIATSVGPQGQNSVVGDSNASSDIRRRRSTVSSILGGIENAYHPNHDAEENVLPAETNTARHFWYFIVLFRFSVRGAWKLHPSWYDDVVQIAKYSPPLLVYRGGAAVGFLDSELEYTPALRAGGTEKLMSELRSLLPQHHKFRHLGFQHLVFLVAVHQLETLRASQLEFRPMLMYLGDEGIESSVALQGLIDVIADASFKVFLDTAYEQRLSEPDEMHLQLQKICVFVLSHCGHRYERVRALATQFVYRTIEKFPRLMWDSLCTSVLLDLVHLLSVRFKGSNEVALYGGTSSPGSDEHKWLAFNKLDLAVDQTTLSQALVELFTLAYTWLSRAMAMVPAEMTAVLQEYVMGFKIPHVSHVGVSLAKEMTSSSTPTSQFFDAMRDSTSSERSQAATRVAALQNKQAFTKSTQYSFTTGVAMKAFYLGEVKGLTMAASTFDRDAQSQLEKPNNAEKLMLENYVQEFTLAISNDDLSVEQLIQYMYRGAAIVRTLLGAEDEPTASYVQKHNMERTLNMQLSRNNAFEAPDSLAGLLLRVLHLISWAPARRFHTQTVAAAIFVWRWLLIAYPSLSSLILAESVGAFKWTVAHRVGLFFPILRSGARHTLYDTEILRPGDDLCSSQSSHKVNDDIDADELLNPLDTALSDPGPHDGWLEFFAERINAASDHSTAVAHALQAALSNPDHLSYDPRSFGPRFRLLVLSLRVMHLSYNVPGLMSSQERRILREKLYEAALLWFDAPMLWSEPFSTSLLITEDFNVLVTFADRIASDADRWSQDYQDGDVESGNLTSEAAAMISPSHTASEGIALNSPVTRTIHSGVTMSQLELPRILSVSSITSLEEPQGSESTQSGQGRRPSTIRPNIPKFADVARSSRLLGHPSLLKYMNRHPTTREEPPDEAGSITERPSLASVSESNAAHQPTHSAPSRSATRRSYRGVREFPTYLKRLSSFQRLLLLLLRHEMDRIWAFHADQFVHEKYHAESRKLDRAAFARHALPHKITGSEMCRYVRHAWMFKPTLALRLLERFPVHKSVKKELEFIAQQHPATLRSHWQAVNILATDESIQSSAACLLELAHWAPAPAFAVIGLLSRWYSSSSANRNHMIFRYCLRSLGLLRPDVIQFHLSSLVQLLRRDLEGGLNDFLLTASKHSMLVAHQLVWILQTEAVVDTGDHSHHGKHTRNNSSGKDVLGGTTATTETETHGYCSKIEGADPLPAIASKMLNSIITGFGVAERALYDQEFQFFESITAISGQLKQIRDKDTHNAYIQRKLESLTVYPSLYLPTSPYLRVVGCDVTSGTPMQSAAKCPFLLVFHVEQFDGPDAAVQIAEQLIANKQEEEEEKSDEDSDEKADMSPREQKDSPKKRNPLSLLTPRVRGELSRPVRMLSTRLNMEGLVERLKKVNLKRRRKTRFISNDFQDEKTRLEALDRSSAEFGRKTNVTTQACIFKVYDDCRQDAMTVQIIHLFKECFEHVGIKLKLVPYNVIPARAGEDKAVGGIIHVIPKCKSRDQIGKAGSKDLVQYFTSQFGRQDSFAFQKAQQNFAASLAGYAIVCYLLSIKDRHNGNLLIDDMGHVIHIDFGFLLGISPGGNLGFETAAFKLTNEMMDILGGTPESEAFNMFVEMTIRGFMAARQLMEPVIALISSQADSGLPCFSYKDDNLAKLRARFVPQLTDSEAGKYMRDLIFDAIGKWTTTVYDGIQKLQNNIHSDVWR